MVFEFGPPQEPRKFRLRDDGLYLKGMGPSRTDQPVDHLKGTGLKVLRALVQAWPGRLTNEAIQREAGANVGQSFAKDYVSKINKALGPAIKGQEAIDNERREGYRFRWEAIEVKQPPPPPPADWDPYLAYIRRECGFIDLVGIVVGGNPIAPIPVADLYVDLPVAGGQDADDARTLESAKTAAGLLLVTGDPGSGKSCFLKKSAWDLTHKGATQFPLYIGVKDLDAHVHDKGRNASPEAGAKAAWLRHYLAAQSKFWGWGLNEEDFHGKLRAGGTVVFLDGLDEATSPKRREAMTEIFLEAVSAYKHAHFIVTTRPNAPEFEKLVAANRAAAGPTASELPPRFRRIGIGSLDSEKREEFIRKLSGCFIKQHPEAASQYDAAGLIAAVESRPEISQMATNPLMLTVIALIYWDGKTLPDQRAELFEQVLKQLAKAHSKPGMREPEECLRILGELALAMQCHKGGRTTQISLGEAAGIVAEEFRLDERLPPIPRLRREEAAYEFLEKETLDSGIVVMRGYNLEYWHATFREFLAARSCRHLPEKDLVSVLVDQGRVHSPEWREVMLLLAGLLITRWPTKLDAVFGAVLDEAERDGSLAAKARAVDLMGAMLLDLRPHRYDPPDSRWKEFLNDALGVFDLSAAEIPMKTRIRAAEAIGQAGDPRLRSPKDDDYWVPIAAGKFWMGAQSKKPKGRNYDPEARDDEGPVREVPVNAFQIGRYPVTVQEYSLFLEDSKLGAAELAQAREADNLPRSWDTQILYPNHPVTGVSCDQAQAFCALYGCRLPKEAEWEFAARGKESRKYPWGDEPPDASRANYSGIDVGAATPVGLFPNGATPNGIRDMAGNVWEWTDDWYGKERDPHVVRGGSCYYDSRNLRAAYRYYFLEPGFRNDFCIGFRCVREA